MKKHSLLWLSLVVFLLASVSRATTNATQNGDWISVGVPADMFVGSAGDFFLVGNDMGSCASTVPAYIRSDMNQQHWKELYAFFLYAHAQQKPLMCVVASGCGTNQVWVTYCRAPLQ
jgi:hypothetical protein